MESLEYWNIPLGKGPEVEIMDRGFHGQMFPIERFKMRGLWLLNFYHTPADLLVDGQPFTVDYGSVSVVAPDVIIEYRYHSRPFHDRFAHFKLNGVAHETQRIPIIQQLGADFKRLNAEFESATISFERHPARGEAKVWDILWQLVERSAASESTHRHPALQAALDYIEANLDGTVHTEDIVVRSGISYPHLARLFQQSHHTTIGRHIRRRRVERAEYLLKFTDIAIKDIAAQVGIPDLHTFNKTVRKELVKSPTQIRQAADRAERS